MQFLTLTSEVSQPFVIPAVSPVSQPVSRKNSLADSAQLPQDLDTGALDEALVDSLTEPLALPTDSSSVASPTLDSPAAVPRQRSGSLALL
ncbi:hypothetical protein TBLA_0I00820 [Henningerozyma blattae CBS 6284]|uniref:Uncharacterized protein n=1 Tax=Henningerozyma blattae (strain ATCC 34711 / CBS 6284 / DSM 70876 / NBRC 10599 / NRRL Y-10934 / UCD 77-7) TaxID=1071380 RepID=I2H8N9_HENB6|nr:hypothetical protein TBLA_0I00820 [Tetrapisispora blattae CBS 6284]CCH62741.1 hypothetical protein TBLA_0I00820 [Tetrapisispora blattae CBS 6284]